MAVLADLATGKELWKRKDWFKKNKGPAMFPIRPDKSSRAHPSPAIRFR